MIEQSAMFSDSLDAPTADAFRDVGSKRPRHYAAEILALPPADRAAAIAATPWPTLVIDHIQSHELRHGRLEALIEARARMIAALPTTLQQQTEFQRVSVRHRSAVASCVEKLIGVRLLSGGDP